MSTFPNSCYLHFFLALTGINSASGIPHYSAGNSTITGVPSTGLTSTAQTYTLSSATSVSAATSQAASTYTVVPLSVNKSLSTSLGINASHTAETSFNGLSASSAASSVIYDTGITQSSNSSVSRYTPGYGTAASSAVLSAPSSSRNGSSRYSYHAKVTATGSVDLSPNGTAGLVPLPPQFTPKDWSNEYRGSEQCTKDAMEFYNITAIPTLDRQLYTFTVPAGQTYTPTVRPEKYNARTLTITGPTTTVYTEPNQAAQDGPVQACCGGCEITAWYVDVKFWPQPGADTRCLAMETPVKTRGGIPWPTKVPANSGNIPIAYPTSVEQIGARITPRALQPTLVKRDGGNGTGEHEVIAVEDGHTFTSPYLYVVYSSIWAQDRCGPHGGLYTSITWSFLPGQLSSLDHEGYTRRFDENDLPCRSKGYWSDGLYHPATLAAVPQLNLLEPSYKNCFVGYWQGLDPPFAFSAKTDFFDTTTADAEPTPPPASPQSTYDRPPQQTSDPESSTNSDSKPPPKPKPEPEPKPQPGSSAPYQADPSPAPILDPPSRPTVTQIPPQTTPPPIIVGPHTASVDPVRSVIHIGSNTVKPGEPVTIANTPISIAPGSVEAIVGSSTHKVENQPALAPVTAGGETLASSPGNFEIGGQTIHPGSPAITIKSTPISIAPGGASALIGSSTIDLRASTFQTPVLLAGHPLTPTGTNFEIAGQTLTPGAPAITIHNTPLSIPPGGSSAVLGSSTLPLPPLAAPSPVIGGQTLTPAADGSSHYLVNGHTLVPGAPPTTVQGQTHSLAPDGREAVVDGETLALPPRATPMPIVVNGLALTPSGSVYVADGTTVTPGGSAATVGGTTVSLASAGPSVYVGDKAHPLRWGDETGSARKTFEAEGRTFTALPGGKIAVGERTFGVGETVTVGGTKISLGADGSGEGDKGGEGEGEGQSQGQGEYIVIGTKTFDIDASEKLPAQTVAGEKITPLAGGRGVVVHGKTYTPGEKFTAGGQVVAVTSGGVVLETGSVKGTKTNNAAASSTDPSVGDYVMGGIRQKNTTTEAAGLGKQGVATGTAAEAAGGAKETQSSTGDAFTIKFGWELLMVFVAATLLI